MRILLVAYDYPPVSSPQAIRWYYLTRELSAAGLDVHVLAPDIPCTSQALPTPDGVVVHRCDAGGLAGWLGGLRRRSGRNSILQSSGAKVDSGGASRLNWKGRAARVLESVVGLWTFPDASGQWKRSAMPALARCLEELRPDILICSHQPPVSLELALATVDGSLPWLADLGDPVLAPYTPRRWRARASKLERLVSEHASAVSVTTEEASDLLMQRHASSPERIFVLSQGFDDATPRNVSVREGIDGDIHLLYTGRFYAFRDPVPLLEAVLRNERFRLSIVSPEVSKAMLEYQPRSRGRIMFLGGQPHARVLQLQQQCDVLVNIGNALPAQTPGKLFEYLGSGKPILHCSANDDDPAIELMKQWGCGWVCHNDRSTLAAFLSSLDMTTTALKEIAKGNAATIAEYGWSRLAAKLHGHLEQLCRRRTGEQKGRFSAQE